MKATVNVTFDSKEIDLVSKFSDFIDTMYVFVDDDVWDAVLERINDYMTEAVGYCGWKNNSFDGEWFHVLGTLANIFREFMEENKEE